MIWGTILEFWRSVRERERGKDMAKSYPPDRMFPSIYLTSLAMVATRKAMLDYQRKVIFGNKLFYSIRKNLWFWGNFKSECCARIERGARDFAFFAHQFCAAKMYRIELNFAQCTELGSILRKNVQNILRKNVQNWAQFCAKMYRIELNYQMGLAMSYGPQGNARLSTKGDFRQYFVPLGLHLRKLLHYHFLTFFFYFSRYLIRFSTCSSL